MNIHTEACPHLGQCTACAVHRGLFLWDSETPARLLRPKQRPSRTRAALCVPAARMQPLRVQLLTAGG
ncbi:hypothetical protein AOLI_G00132820 [Acnodon oligacanthus]